jgi:putative ABC transport system ATP-binding protein
MLEIINGTKKFNEGTGSEQTALNQLNLKVGTGDFLTVIGSNGAGKSSLMNAISGGFYLDKGKILLDGHNITYLSEHKRAKVIGRVFQDPSKGTAPNLTLEENLALAYSRSQKKPLQIAVSKKDQQVFKNLLAQFDMGLENRLKDKTGLLSGGQRQALSLAMCIIASPKLLLLDEHTAALDPSTAEKVSVITDTLIRQNGLTAIMITHNLSNAIKYGNRLVMMTAGTISTEISGEEKQNTRPSALMELYDQDPVLY